MSQQQQMNQMHMAMSNKNAKNSNMKPHSHSHSHSCVNNLPKKTKMHKEIIDQVTCCVNELSTTEKRDILAEMKNAIHTDEATTCVLLENNPQLAQALLLIQIQFGLVTGDDVKALTETVNNDVIFPNYVNPHDNDNLNNTNGTPNNGNNENKEDSDITMGNINQNTNVSATGEMSPIIEETCNNSNNNSNNGNNNNNISNVNTASIDMGVTNSQNTCNTSNDNQQTAVNDETKDANVENQEKEKEKDKDKDKNQSEQNDNEYENEDEQDSDDDDDDDAQESSEEESDDDQIDAAQVHKFVQDKYSSLGDDMRKTIIKLLLLPPAAISKLPHQYQDKHAYFEKKFKTYLKQNGMN